MNGDTDPLSSMLRPFKPLPFTRRTPGEVEAGLIRETDAHAALQSELASGGLSRITPDLADDLLSQFGVEGEQARRILIELWQHAYKKLLFRDDQIDRGEDDYLERLQHALGLSRDEIRRARAEVPDVEEGSSSA